MWAVEMHRRTGHVVPNPSKRIVPTGFLREAKKVADRVSADVLTRTMHDQPSAFGKEQ
jgi:hypothetical protein